MDDFWVFGYGSLMWNPGFEHIDAQPATLNGFHRAPCIYSWVHRGTPKKPGIVLGLAPGGSCQGIAFRVQQENKQKTMKYLRERELITGVYIETEHDVRLEDGNDVKALTYIANTKHQQYAKQKNHNILVKHIVGAVGKSGKNEDYFFDTLNKLNQLGINDDNVRLITQNLRTPK